MSEVRYKPVGSSTTSPTSVTKRKEILVPQVLTDYTLYYHYGDLDRTPVRNATFLATLSDGEVRKGALDDKGQAQICGVARGPVSVEYQYDAPDTDDQAIVAARDKIRQALDAIVAQTKLDMADEWKEWHEANWLTRRYLEVINTGQGTAVGAWHWLSGTVDCVWQLGVLIYKLDKEKRDINWLFITGQWAELDKKLANYRRKRMVGSYSTRRATRIGCVGGHADCHRRGHRRAIGIVLSRCGRCSLRQRQVGCRRWAAWGAGEEVARHPQRCIRGAGQGA